MFLQDILELREQKWIASAWQSQSAAALMTLAQVHEAVSRCPMMSMQVGFLPNYSGC